MPSVINAANVESVLEMWRREADRGGEPLRIDLAKVGSVERLAGGVLSTALLGSLGDAAVQVELPSGHRRAEWLWASGLAFALANRLGPTYLSGTSAADHTDLRAWRERWRPGMEETWREMLAVSQVSLFSPAEIGESSLAPDLFGPTYAAFVDPHLNQLEDDGQHPITTVVWPWLDRLLPGKLNGESPNARRGFIRDVGEFVTETLLNVADHAVGYEQRRVRSLAQVAVTTGGHGAKLYLSVQDTGPGILTTARPKLADTLWANAADEALMTDLLEGKLPPWGRGRGIGLPEVTATARKRRGQMTIATGRTRCRFGPAGAIVATTGGFDLHGSVVAVMFPIPAAF
jgi:hypothetical protein